MTVARIAGTECAAWTYLDERDLQCWKAVMRTGPGQWVEIDGDGVSYHQTGAKLREFIDEWIADAALGDDDPGPTVDTIEVYRLAAEFIDEAGASG